MTYIWLAFGLTVIVYAVSWVFNLSNVFWNEWDMEELRDERDEHEDGL